MPARRGRTATRSARSAESQGPGTVVTESSDPDATAVPQGQHASTTESQDSRTPSDLGTQRDEVSSESRTSQHTDKVAVAVESHQEGDGDLSPIPQDGGHVEEEADEQEGAEGTDGSVHGDHLSGEEEQSSSDNADQSGESSSESGSGSGSDDDEEATPSEHDSKGSDASDKPDGEEDGEHKGSETTSPETKKSPPPQSPPKQTRKVERQAEQQHHAQVKQHRLKLAQEAKRSDHPRQGTSGQSQKKGGRGTDSVQAKAKPATEQLPPPLKTKRMKPQKLPTGGAARKRSGKALRDCPVCSRPQCLGVADPHDKCLSCLGERHDMAACRDCQALSWKTRVERGRQLLWWASEGGSSVPSVRTIRALVGMGDCCPRGLAMSEVLPLVGDRPPTPKKTKTHHQSTRRSPSPARSPSRDALDDDILDLDASASDITRRDTLGEESDSEMSLSGYAQDETDSSSDEEVAGDKPSPVEESRSRRALFVEPNRARPSSSGKSTKLAKHVSSRRSSDSREKRVRTQKKSRSPRPGLARTPALPAVQPYQPADVSVDTVHRLFVQFMEGRRAEAASQPAQAPKTPFQGRLADLGKPQVLPTHTPLSQASTGLTSQLSPVVDSASDLSASTLMNRIPHTATPQDVPVGYRHLSPERSPPLLTEGARLLPGRSLFDWDQEGTLVPGSAEASEADRTRVTVIDQLCQELADELRLEAPAPVEPPKRRSSSVPRAAYGEATPSTGPEFPMDGTFQDIILDARKHRGLKPRRLVPPAVLMLYRTTPTDWADLGAVRRPDPILRAHCGRLRSSQAGAPLSGHNDRGLEARDRLLADNIQLAAHQSRPLNVAGLAAGQALSAVTACDQVWRSRHDGDREAEMRHALDKAQSFITLCAEAVTDAFECTARLQAASVRALRDSWLDASTLPPELVREVKQADVVGGIVPAEPRTQFTGPLCGPKLISSFDALALRCDKEKAIAARAKGFNQPHKRPSAGAHPHSKAPKKFRKNYNQSPVVAPTQQGRSQEQLPQHQQQHSGTQGAAKGQRKHKTSRQNKGGGKQQSGKKGGGGKRQRP